MMEAKPKKAYENVVDVVEIHTGRLEASVEVLDDDNLIEDNERIVPLMELYPIKNQSKQFNVLTTATCLDQLRFFYDRIWKPWDVNDEVSEDWVDEHLELRINLLTLSPTDPTNIKLNRLAAETVSNQARIEQLDDLDGSRNDEEGDEIVIEKYDVYLRDEKIRKEVEILENPTLRLAKMRLDRRKKVEGHPEGREYPL
ncbi:SHC SH2 domainbinding protein 1 -like protein Blike [Caligus rogercresseyi]|uniref:SHC SH2 domainbinding protein 1 -like protein Blike n=1 Tax=Caligus rogercresseyi TaxID=217165 RepID=A0A7T8QWN6_CALRO|nr:SHC SH2 domainbinding protein 1 -like protein Blike [Caligus rogercresseyi]